MRKLLMFLAVLIVTVIPTHAQESYPKVEIYGGYSFFSSNQFPDRENLNSPGFGASIAGNLSKNFGLVAEISGNYGQVTLPGLVPDVTVPEFDTDVYTFLVGPRVTSRSTGFDLFGHVLFGGARTKVERFESDTDFAMAVGGGVDINVSKRIAVRIFQVDYLPIKSDRNLFRNEEWSHNVRFQIGVVFRVGGE
ncbi:MAG: porin family protein [Blastocatellia bacterium]|nr:porin family protein [Blastocatellia bacterium]